MFPVYRVYMGMSKLILNWDAAAVADADGDNDDTGDTDDDDDYKNDDDDVVMLKKPMRKLVFLPEMLTAAPELGHPAHDTKLLRIMRRMISMKKKNNDCECCPRFSLFKDPYKCWNCCYQLS